jgi:hypothetical protein
VLKIAFLGFCLSVPVILPLENVVIVVVVVVVVNQRMIAVSIQLLMNELTLKKE